jgi:VWFA-related protein
VRHRLGFAISLSVVLVASFTALCLTSAPTLQGQIIPEDEFRWGSQPFTPLLPGAIVSQVNLVEVNVVVRDSRGKPVEGLTQDDFEILDQGKKQRISLFSAENSSRVATPPPVNAAPVSVNQPPPAPPPAPKPRYVAFYFDDDNMATPDLTFARKAAEKFVNESMEPNDLVGIFTSSTTVTHDFTNDKQKLISALGRILSHQKAPTELGSCPRIGVYQAFLIYNKIDPQARDLAFQQGMKRYCQPDYGGCSQQVESMLQNQAAMIVSIADGYAKDTLGVLNEVLRYLEKKDGRRMLLMASSGYFARSTSVRRAQDKVVDTALHAGVVINSLDTKGLSVNTLGGNPADGPPILLGAQSISGGRGPPPQERPDLDAYADMLANDTREVSDDPLEFLADGTGGRFFHNSNDLGRGVREMAAVPEVSYAIGISPDNLKSDGEYHSLKVKLTKRTNLSVSARPGYFAPTKGKSAPAEKYARLNHAVLSQDNAADIPSEVTAVQGTLGSGETAIKVTVHVDVRGIPFKKQNGRHEERLIFITALFDMHGKFLTGAEGVMDFALRDASLEEIFKEGVTAKLSLQVPPGQYRLRQVVQEVANGKINSMSRAVEIQ